MADIRSGNHGFPKWSLNKEPENFKECRFCAALLDGAPSQKFSCPKCGATFFVLRTRSEEGFRTEAISVLKKKGISFREFPSGNSKSYFLPDRAGEDTIYKLSKQGLKIFDALVNGEMSNILAFEYGEE